MTAVATIETKIQELCEAIVADEEVRVAREHAEAFLADEDAVSLYRQMASLGRALPASAPLSLLQFSPGELRWQAPAVTSERIEAARETLRRQGYQLVADGNQWVMRAEVRP